MDRYDYLLQNPFGDDDIAEAVQRLLNSDLASVNFTYSKEEISKIIDEYIQKKQLDDKKIYGVIEDYEDQVSNSEAPIKLANEVKKFFYLADRNNIEEVESIISNINSLYNLNMSIPSEIMQTIEEIKKHREYLLSLKLKERAAKYQKESVEKSNLETKESAASKIKDNEEIKIQQERLNEIQSKLPIINEKIESVRNAIDDKNKVFQLLKERTYFYNKKSNITLEDINRLNAYIEELDALEKSHIPVTDNTTPVPTQEDIEEFKKIFNRPGSNENNSINEKIVEYDQQMAKLMEKIEPYMYREDVSAEMAKVDRENNKAKELLATGSEEDYRKAVEIKERLVAYLERANAFIDERKKESKTAQVKNTNNVPYDDIPEMYNPDGTYTAEYIAHIVAVAEEYGGKEMGQTVYKQLQQYSNEVLAKKGFSNEINDMMKDSELTNGEIDVGPRQYGFSASCILGIAIAISGVIIILVSYLMR